MFSRVHCPPTWLSALLLMGWLLLAGAAQAAAPVTVLRLDGIVGPASADYVVGGIRHAAQTDSQLVVLQLDTPGGLDSSMRAIIKEILASPVPIATHVTPSGARAASAGTYMLYASHVAAMSPGTNLGAATPVQIGGTPAAPPEDPPDKQAPAGEGGGDAMSRKQVNDASAYIRGLAQLRGRNAEWAERAVREAVSLTAEEALKQRVVDVVASSVPDLLAQIDGRTVRTPAGEVQLATGGAAHELHAPGWRHRLLSVIANPSFALILMTGGHYTYAETPLGDWVQQAFDLQRNHYDRLGHFLQGFVPAILARELLLRCTPLRRGGWLVYLVLAACLSFSAFFEFLEWWAALIGGGAADAYLATQGDVWDTQWDMFLALVGAALAQATLSRVHDRQLDG